MLNHAEDPGSEMSMHQHKYLFSEESFKLVLIEEAVSIAVCKTNYIINSMIRSFYPLIFF